MTAERSNKIKALRSEALDCPESERAEFLNRVCGDDLQLKSEVEKLLASDQEDHPLLQNLAVAEVAGVVDSESAAGSPATLDSSPPRFEVGVLLNERYKILRLLGRGGMGEVYLASDTRFRRKVALKVLRSDLASSKEGLRRFALEAQAVSALNHPHIMTIYEFSNTEDGDLFFVAEYVDGTPLNRLIRANLNLEKALDIGLQVSSALSAAHEAGITHRDIKPENIMVRRDDYVKVLDFGLVKLTQGRKPSPGAGSEDPTEALGQTRPGAVMGTTAYMSPEQARGLPVDARTDLWSLGVVIYEMLTGRRPFAGETKSDLLVSVLSSEPPPLASDEHDFPAELKWIVSKALSKNVDGRYQTAKELRADLAKIKKRIEFDEASRNDHPREKDRTLSILEQVAPTSANTAAPTRAEHDDSAAPGSFSSSPSVAWIVRQVKTTNCVRRSSL
ncbi:MAG: serine/threonine protein kinase [Acidobacteria bacterium]|nr:serine/threonine protein kinase [Acidobacteriota bacterium]